MRLGFSTGGLLLAGSALLGTFPNALHGQGARLYVGNSTADNISVITRDGRSMYVALSDLHGFAIVDIPEKRVVRRVEMPAENPTPHEHPGEPINTLTHGLALSPDERELWVTSLLDDAMYVYDVSSQKIVGRVPVGSGPNWVAFSPDGKYVCVSNAAEDDVSIIDVKARGEVARLKVGQVPKRLVAASVGGEPAKQPPSR